MKFNQSKLNEKQFDEGGNISFGIAFVAGNIRVPKPATGITTFLT